MNNKWFVKDDIVRSYQWLGHNPYGYTELIGFNWEYKSGRENYETNRRLNLFPKIWHTKRPEAAVKFVKRYYKDHTCCYGINPRPWMLKTSGGRSRSARDADIKVVQNFYLDIDPMGWPSDEQVAEMELFMVKTEPYFADLGVCRPEQAFTGRGYHLLFAMPPILVEEHGDIKDRLNRFRQDFGEAFSTDLSGLELKLDNTMDLSRVAKMYGTRKPGGARVSRFYGGQRREDERLRAYLLSLNIEERDDSPVLMPDQLPHKFEVLLTKNRDIKGLWDGTGKKQGDTSNSGYDYSLIRRCMNQGITDIRDLGAILALRPNGAVQQSNKGDQYIKTTIANAIKQ